MNVVQALIMGLVQGITEFLPISSSGHLVLLQKLLGVDTASLFFVTMLHLGTLIAVVWAFRRDVMDLVRHPFTWRGIMLLLALVPTAVIGAVFEELFENLFQSAVTVGFEFVITGAILWWMDTVDTGDKTEDDMEASDALWIGALQGIAILPALSRSGLTIAGGLWRGMKRESAARFSFLLSIPAILGATAVEFDDVLEEPTTLHTMHWFPIIIGTLAAVVAGYGAVKLTMWLVRRSRMRIFALYCWALAVFVFIDQLFTHHFFPPLIG